MKKVKTLLVLAVLAFAVLGGWRVGAYAFNNMELQQDMLDLSSGANTYSNYSHPLTDDDIRAAVVRDALNHDIKLDPSRVTVRRMSDDPNAKVFLSADYTELVTLPGYSFTLHFTPTSEKKLF